MIEFINTDAENILADIIAYYENESGQTLNDADPERIIIDCMSYREVLLRVAMQYLMQQNFVQLAEGASLDYWGELFTVARNDGEDDESYRSRILLTTSVGGLGTKAAYKARVLSVDNVADVLIHSKNDDNTMVPGKVRFTPIEKTTDPVSLIESGIVHGQELETSILNVVLADDFGIMGNIFEFKSAVPVVVDGTISVTKTDGYIDADLVDNINYQVSRYFGQLSLSFESEFGLTSLQNYLMNAEGLSQIVNLNFGVVPSLNTGEFYQKGVITINIQQ